MTDAPKAYNIPTGTQYYDITREYAGFPEELVTLIKVVSKLPVIGWAVGLFCEIFKSGSPGLLTHTGDIDVTLDHTEIEFTEPGAACYWFQVQLECKTTQAIRVQALRGHTM